MRSLTRRTRDCRTSCFLFWLGTQPAERRIEPSQFFLSCVTHHPPILLALHDLEQIDDVLVEIKDLPAQLKVGVTQEIQLIVLLNVLTSTAEEKWNKIVGNFPWHMTFIWSNSLPCKTVRSEDLCSRFARQCRWNVGSESKAEVKSLPRSSTANTAAKTQLSVVSEPWNWRNLKANLADSGVWVRTAKTWLKQKQKHSKIKSESNQFFFLFSSQKGAKKS